MLLILSPFYHIWDQDRRIVSFYSNFSNFDHSVNFPCPSFLVYIHKLLVVKQYEKNFQALAKAAMKTLITIIIELILEKLVAPF